MEVFGGIPNKNLINIVNTDRKFEYFKAVPRNKNLIHIVIQTEGSTIRKF